MAADRVASLFAFFPKVMRPQTTDLSGGVLWGATALTAAIFVVQPFSWIKDQVFPPPPAEDK